MLKFWRRKKKVTESENSVTKQVEEQPEQSKQAMAEEPIALEPEPAAEIVPEPIPEPVIEEDFVEEVPEPQPEIGGAQEELVQEPDPIQEEPAKESWASRLTKGLSKSSSKLTTGITDIFTKRKLDEAALEELEELLIMADMGPATAAQLTADIAKTRFGKDVEPGEVKQALADGVAQILEPVAKPLLIDEEVKPYVILVVGVNGTGKTTTIAKLAQEYAKAGKSVVLAAGDTFRAAAVEQLQIWAERTGAHFVGKEIGADAAAVAYEAVEAGKQRNADVVIVDTAGRLHNKSNLMDELAKIYRVLQKQIPEAPHATLITLDATTGQNAINQVDMFNHVTPLTGLVVTKLDGSAKGGVVVSLAQKFNIPIHAVGVGEGADDLQIFDAKDFAKALVA